MNQRVGVEELRAVSSGQMAAQMLIALAPNFKPHNGKTGMHPIDPTWVMENYVYPVLDLAEKFQEEAERRVDKARNRDMLAGNT